MLFDLQQTVESLQRHLHEFLDYPAHGEVFEPVTSGAVTQPLGQAQSAFIELNRDCVLPAIHGPEHPIQRWRGRRLLGIDSSLVRLPESAPLGQTFGWKEAANHHGTTGTRFPEVRLSVLYDLLKARRPGRALGTQHAGRSGFGSPKVGALGAGGCGD